MNTPLADNTVFFFLARLERRIIVFACVIRGWLG